MNIKGILIAVAVLAIVGGTTFVLFKTGVLGKKGDDLSIDETANVVTEIKKISEFTSACYYEEIILRDTKKGYFKKNELVIVANGKVRAGFRLDQLDSTSVQVFGDTLNVDLPKAEIFDVIVNPSGFDIYIEDGKWDHNLVTKLENKAINQIKSDAIKEGILKTTTKSGVKKLTEMFKAFGFSVVNITVEGQEVEIEEENA